MNIALTHGYFISEDAVEQGIMKPYPPQGLLYISAWLKKSGIPVEMIDTTFSGMQDLERRLEECKPGILGIYTNLMTRANVLKIIGYTRQSKVLCHTKIIIGGPDARHYAGDYLSEGADVIIPGEGEMVFAELSGLWSSGNAESPEDIKGVFFRDKEGTVIYTGERDMMDLRQTPIPSYDGIDVQKYLHQWKSANGYSSMAVSSMRGCPYSCNWCSKSVFGNTYRRREPGAVVEEMIALKNKFNTDQVWFTDDVFTISRLWLKEFCDAVEKHKLELPYECISRSDCMDEEMIGLLKRSGCRKVWMGAESGSQKVIDLMNRKIDISRTEQVMTELRSNGIGVGVFIMLGYPGENRKDLQKTARFLERTEPDDLTIGVSYPIKGTKYYEIAEPLFYHPYDWRNLNERQIRFKRTYSDRFYRFSARYLFNRMAFLKTKQGFQKWTRFTKAMVSKTYILVFS